MAQMIYPVVEPGDTEKETGRLEAFSDGVLAIAITLLALNLTVPSPSNSPDFSLWQELLKRWPTYLAFLVSFLFVLVIWINHHRLFLTIRRSDSILLLLNGLLLMSVTIIPFSTQLVASYLQTPDARVAGIVYNGLFFMISIFFNAIYHYAAYNNRLFDKKTDPKLAAAIGRRYLVGPIAYAVAVLIAQVSVSASLLLNLLLAVFFAIPYQASRSERQ
ncbi:MAG TPA: TMEM175 family protein [Aggregatilineales bacterium]|nr:TMEM175 family protein [Aggregatilineales bacterium]